eukprot:CAMPEP_0115246784 /NCGR_PEP_ID=MMETSP0270-20121206/41209_1 /TAXON_ID=71861 /ORGANISM="Scrippsiella trochoidea, Strain CCMP3099" /LENGTH=31 /DNA_ID= /DNA_START= /DNA_END= /DNA_ORIENTATION=
MAANDDVDELIARKPCEISPGEAHCDRRRSG